MPVTAPRRTALALLLLLAVGALFPISPALALDAPPPIFLDGRPLQMAAPVLEQAGHLLVPVRSLVEAMGGTVTWEPPDRVTVTRLDRSLALTIDSVLATANGSPLTLPVAARLADGYTYLPLRSVGEGLGARVAFDGSAVRITTSNPAGGVQPDGDAPWLLVTSGPLRVRSGPGPQYPILTSVPAGTFLYQIDESDGWIQVRQGLDGTGWVSAAYTRRAVPEVGDNPADLDVGYLQLGSECLGPNLVLGTTLYAPLRQTVERLGASVGWADGITTVSYGPTQLVLASGTMQAQVDGEARALPGPALTVGGRLLVPAAGLADALGLGMTWDAASGTARIAGTPVSGAGVGPCNPAAQASAYVVMGARSGFVLAERAADAPLPIASTTKIMTALFALERGNLNDLVYVSRYAASRDCTCVPLRAGNVYPLREMLYGLLLPSGNDAASAIAEHISGGEWAFARQMTQRAQELGATNNTQFYDASGLDDAGRSSARDLARIARIALMNPDFRQVVGSEYHRLTGPTGAVSVRNLDQFLSRYPGATGVKNGWTPSAGHTLVASAARDGRELIVVILGAPTRDAMYNLAAELMDRGFQLSARNWLAQVGVN